MTNAVSLNGSTQYIEVPNYSAIDAITDGSLTLEGWFYNDSTSSVYSSALSFGHGTTQNTYLVTENATGSEGVNFAYVYSTTNADGYRSDSVFIDNTWVHIAVVHQLNQKTKVYKDGTEISYVLQQTPSGTANNLDSSVLRIGHRFDGGNLWKGAIGGFIRVWNTIRTQTEISNNKDYTLQSAQETGLILNLNFTEGSGSTVANETGDSDGTIYGSASWTTGPTTSAKSYGGSAFLSRLNLLGVG